MLWDGSFGYDLASVGIRQMYQNLKQSVANLCKYEADKGGELFIGFEPKPNEGYPAMLIPTVASALIFWRKLEEEFGISRDKKGVNKEFGHSEMIGLDHLANRETARAEDMMRDAVVSAQIAFNDMYKG